MMFLVGTRLYAPKEGLLSAALIAVLLFPVYYGQEARPYSTLLLLVLSAYWHYFGLFFIFIQGLVTFAILLRKPKALVHVALIYGAIALALLPWVSSMWAPTSPTNTSATPSPPATSQQPSTISSA
jgi:hypothetical protein